MGEYKEAVIYVACGCCNEELCDCSVCGFQFNSRDDLVYCNGETHLCKNCFDKLNNFNGGIK